MYDPKLMVVAIEGINGAGKTTTLRHVKEILTEKGIDTESVFFPGNTEVGAKLRSILLDKTTNISPMAEMLMFASDHCETWTQKIESQFGPRDKPMVILCDRSLLSSVAFQGIRGVPEDMIVRCALAPCENVFLSRIYVLNVPWHIAHERLLGRGVALDRIEVRSQETQKQTADVYQEVSLRGTFAGTPVIGLNGQDDSIINARKIVNDINSMLGEV